MRSLFPKALLSLIAAASPLSLAAMSQVTNTTSVSIGLTIPVIQALVVTAPTAVALRVTSAVEGNPPTSVSDNTSTYAISTNIATALNVSGSTIPAGVNFQAQYGASGSLGATGNLLLASASSAGATTSIFGSIGIGVYNGSITYTVGAPISTNPFSDQSFQLSYTLQ